MGEVIDWFNQIARRKLGAGPDWRWCVVQAVGSTDTTLVRGGVPRLKRSGKDKGGTTWRGVTLSDVTVTRDELRSEKANHEASTGECAECFGTGQRLSGWSVEHGTEYRPCSRCDATGKAVEVSDG